MIRKYSMLLTLVAIASLSLVGYTNCGKLYGTDTGNPGSSNASPASPAGAVPFEDVLANSLCSKITECFAPGTTDCTNKMKIAANITSHLGAPALPYPNLQTLQAAVDSRTLTPNSTKLSSCLTTIDALLCTDTNVTNAYHPGVPDDLTQVYRMLTPSTDCSTIF